MAVHTCRVVWALRGGVEGAGGTQVFQTCVHSQNHTG